ncbi:MAG TPA: hypothetical protein VEL74_05565 [Thermoanaerobaculia bacterium]|nr:hypothetical protein [Thermoanaerobaculia bacterium]
MRRILATLLLAACAGTAGAADGKTVAERCAAATASAVVANSSTAEAAPLDSGWTVQAEGTWAAGAADGVLLEIRIDMDRYHSETRTGASGAWRVSQDFNLCGKHTLRVFAMPMVQDGDRLVHCLERGTSAPQTFDLPCEPVARIDSCTWQCTEDDCAGSCTAGARSGVPDYVAHWGLNDSGYHAVEGFSRGPWTHEVVCKPGEKVTFKVRGRNGTGRWSNVAERACGQPGA